MCIWCRDRCHPIDAMDSRLDDQHNCSHIWVMVERPLGVRNGYAPLHVKFFDDLSSSTLMWNTSTQLKRNPCHWCKGGSIPSTHPQGNTTEPNWLEEGMRACLNKKLGIDSREYPSPIHQTEIDSCWRFDILFSILFVVFMSSYLCVPIVFMCLMCENEHKWPFNVLKQLFILEKVTWYKVLSWLVRQEYTNESLRYRQELFSAMVATWIELSCSRVICLGVDNGVGHRQ